jgi:cell division protein FtsW (lipid II flippase)
MQSTTVAERLRLYSQPLLISSLIVLVIVIVVVYAVGIPRVWVVVGAIGIGALGITAVSLRWPWGQPQPASDPVPANVGPPSGAVSA